MRKYIFIAAILALGSAVSAPVRSMVGAKNTSSIGELDFEPNFTTAFEVTLVEADF